MIKKVIKKIAIISVITSCLIIQSLYVYALPTENVNVNIQEKEAVEPRTDIKEWIYAEINGSLYKRLYNYTRNRWEGDWILVQQGI